MSSYAKHITSTAEVAITNNTVSSSSSSNQTVISDQARKNEARFNLLAISIQKGDVKHVSELLASYSKDPDFSINMIDEEETLLGILLHHPNMDILKEMLKYKVN